MAFSYNGTASASVCSSAFRRSWYFCADSGALAGSTASSNGPEAKRRAFAGITANYKMIRQKKMRFIVHLLKVKNLKTKISLISNSFRGKSLKKRIMMLLTSIIKDAPESKKLHKITFL